MTNAEVAVIGAGIVGAATAWELAARGVDVLLLDRGEVSGGTTGLGEGNVLASDKDSGPELELTVAGMRVYDELEERLAERARIRRKGALIVHPDDASWSAEPERLGRLRAAGVRGELVGPARVRELEPQLSGELRGASYFPDDLQCDPGAITRALAADLPRLGGRVLTGTTVRAIGVNGGRLTHLDTGAGRIGAGAAVLAAGTWSAELAASAGLALPVEPRQGQLVRLSLPRPDAAFIRHKLVDGAYLASVASAETALQISTVIETTWDGDVLVGSSRRRCGFDVSADPSIGDAMVERAARLVPALGQLRRARQWAGLRPWLPDHLPAIGASRRVPGLWVAGGHEGAGVALGPISGRLVAQAYCGESTDVELAPFDPDRFTALEH